MRGHKSILVRALVGGWLLAGLFAPRAAGAATFTISGVVRNEAASGVANVDIDLIEFCTGQNVFLVNDKTLSSGAYSVVVNEGTYDIRFTPPSGSTLAAAEIERVVISSNMDFGVTTLYAGHLVSGVVRNTSGTGLVGVDLDFINLATGRKIYVPNDLTTTGGNYSVRVRSGTYDVEFRPPATTSYVTGLRTGLVISASDVTGLIDVLQVGIQVFGTTVDGSGTPVERADLDFVDVCTGKTIPTAHDNTDVSGNFSVYVPAGTYTIRFAPPRCVSLGAQRLANQLVSTATNLGTITLPDAFAVTGRVLDQASNPVSGADLDFFDAVSGARQATARDNTDASGHFSVLVPDGVYNINIDPPSAINLLVGRVNSISVSGPTSLGDVILPSGIPVSGTVLGPGGSGVLNVDIDVFQPSTSTFVRLAHDHTAANGSFRVVVPTGTYDFRFIPPACSPLAPAELKSVQVTSALTLPTVNLVQGVRASGLVLGPGGAPVTNADLDFFPAGSRVKTFTARDNTDLSGFYSVLVPPGSYDIDYVPPVGSTLRAAQRFGVSLLSDATLPDTILHQGFVVSGFVLASQTGLPVASADLDFVVPGGGATLFTPRDNTALDGSYAVVVDSGTWDILYSPPSGSGQAPRWRRGVAVSSDLALPNTLLLPLTVPTVTSITPTSGPTTGGQSVTVSGTGFQPDATLSFGGVSATGVSAVSSTTLTAITPAHPSGVTDVIVTNPGNQVGTLTAGYTFSSGAVCGNGVVEGGEQCDAGAANGTSASCCSATCQFKSAGTVCRASAGACDVAESCTGTSALCPADTVNAAGTACPDDGKVCTRDVCDGIGTACTHPNEPAGTACPSDGNVCTDDLCDGSGNCAHLNNTAPCSDGNACTTGDICQAGICQSGSLRDADADGHPDSFCGGDDCNDSNPLVWHPPVEVQNLTITTASPASLAWDGQGILAGPETLYDLVSGSLSPSGGLDFSSRTCLQSATATSYSDNRPSPPVGASFWYLVRARNSCGIGTYGSPQRDSAIPPCP